MRIADSNPKPKTYIAYSIINKMPAMYLPFFGIEFIGAETGLINQAILISHQYTLDSLIFI